MTEWTNSWMEEGKQKGLQAGLEQGLQEGRQKGLQEGRQKGLQEGRHQGALRAALRLLGRRIGLPGPEAQARLEALSAEALEDLVEAVLDFQGPEDLVTWLDAR